jgi:DNA polymerase-1
MLEREQVINRGRLRRSMKGFLVDFDFADRFADQYDGHLANAAQLLEKEGIKAGDSASLVRWADKNDLIPPPADHARLKNGEPSGNKKLLERIAHPVVKLFLLHKEQNKTQADYLTKMRDFSVNGRVYPTVAIFGAAQTGRASMGSPPFHQFPGGARGMVLAEDGDPWTSIDWSQIEPVVAANLAGDMAVLHAYETGVGDPYLSIATLAGITRPQGKVVLLADMYGQGIKLMASNLHIPHWDLDRAKAIKAAARAAYAVTAQHFDRIKAAAREHQVIPTVSGRILPVQRQLNDDTGRWEVATHMAVNYHVQGSAYDMLAETLYQTEVRGLGDQVHITMHDETVVSTAAADEIEQIMRTPPPALVRLAGRTPVLRTDRADLGERWAYV